ncbi:MAG: hypothetical protein KF727_05665 [Microbacteriaceae bacterium]|nr:hypothetical protein [Microbacteriaceae bacterium]
MTPLTRARALSLAVITPLVLALAACFPVAGGDQGSGGGTDVQGGISTDDALISASAPTTEFVSMTDPVAQSFTVDVPKGWNSIAYSNGGFDVHREVVSTVSPDGGTVIFLGDPKAPNFWDPDLATDLEKQFADALEFIDLRRYEPAPSYFTNWVEGRFGSLSGYRFVGVEEDKQAASDLMQRFTQAGVYMRQIHVAKIRFSYQSSKGETIDGLVYGYTMDGGKLWVTEVGGIATNRAADDYLDMMSHMSTSKKTSQEWLAARQASHQQTMAQMEAFAQQMTAQHNANMAWIQQSAANHQAHMQAVWAANDASMNAYYNNMASMDTSQQQFLNYVNEEHTVAGPDGQTWQVTTGATNYYVNPTTGAYTGGDINFGEQDLIAMGYNPDDFVQVTVVN